MATQESALRLLDRLVVIQQLGGWLEVMHEVIVFLEVRHFKVRHRIDAARSRLAPNRAERLALKPLDLSGISSSLTLEIEVLANRVIKQTHDHKAY